MRTPRLVLAAFAPLALGACGDAPGTPATPAAGAPATDTPPTPAAAPTNTAGSLADIAGTWVIDIPATRKAAYEATKVEILKTGQQFTEAQVNEYLDQGEASLKRAALENVIKADGTYTGTAVGVQRPVTGVVTFSAGEYTLIPDDQTSVMRVKLIDGRLVNQRPRDPTAQFMALVWMRKP